MHGFRTWTICDTMPGFQSFHAGLERITKQRLSLRLEQGKPAHCCARAATHVRFCGKTLYSRREPGDVDQPFGPQGESRR